MSDQDKPTPALHTSTADFVAQLVAEHFSDKTTGSAEITSIWDGHAGTLTIEIKPTAPTIDLPITYGGSESWTSIDAGPHVVLATIDTTQPTAPENVFMPTENPDGTWTTKIPAGHPAAGVVFGRTHDRAISPDEAERRVPIVMAASHIRDILLGFPAFQRADVLAETGLCRDCGTETDGRRCHCMNDE